jgi:hypothetical protein
MLKDEEMFSALFQTLDFSCLIKFNPYKITTEGEKAVEHALCSPMPHTQILELSTLSWQMGRSAA